MSAYDALASVYDWLVPDVLLEPAGAIAAFGDVLAPGGLLTGTSRNWERLRARRPGLEIAKQLTWRAGRAGLAIRSWSLPDAWDAPHHVEVAVVAQRMTGR